MKSCNISNYDKSGNLVGYVEYEDYIVGQPKCFYSVSGKSLTRILVNEDYESEVPVYESINSYIEFNDNIMLNPLIINGEVMMEIITSASTYPYDYPSSVDRFDTYTDLSSGNLSVDSFRLSSNLIDDCLNKL